MNARATRIMFAVKEIDGGVEDYLSGQMREMLEQQGWQVLIFSKDFHFYSIMFNPVGAIRRWLARQDGNKKAIIDYLREAGG